MNHDRPKGLHKIMNLIFICVHIIILQVLYCTDKNEYYITIYKCSLIYIDHLKYLSAVTVRNFSMNISESRTAMCAARPIIVFAVFGRAWNTSNRTSLHLGFLTIGFKMFATISP